MHIHTNITAPSSRMSALGVSSAMTMLKCCLILPCEATETEIFRVGKHLHSLLKLQGSLYYRTVDTLDQESRVQREEQEKQRGQSSDSHSSETQEGEDDTSGDGTTTNDEGKMTEDSFRRFAKYRIKKEETTVEDSADKHQLVTDHFLAYQTQNKVEYSLQTLLLNGWDRRMSS